MALDRLAQAEAMAQRKLVVASNVGGRLGAIIGNKLRALATHHRWLDELKQAL